MLVGIASTEDPGQIAPLEAVGSGFTLFVEAFFWVCNGVRNFRCINFRAIFLFCLQIKCWLFLLGLEFIKCWSK